MKIMMLLTVAILLKIGCGPPNRVPPALDQLVRGKIAYYIPDQMKIDSAYKVLVTISKAESDKILFSGIDSINFTKDTIKISSRVKVILIDPSGGKDFKIVPLNSEEQLVDDSSNTIWKWSVTPSNGGKNEIVIRASAKVLDRLGENYRDIQVYEKSISVQSSPLRSIKQFLSSNWQWIVSVIIIPIFIGVKKFIGKRQNKKQKTNPIGFRRDN